MNPAGLKNSTSQRSKAVQRLADMIREKWGVEARLRDRDVRHAVAQDAHGLVEPVRDRLARFPPRGQRQGDGSPLAFMVDQKYETAAFKKRTGWRDDENEVQRTAARRREEGPHELDGLDRSGRVSSFRAQQERGRLPLRAAQGLGDYQAQERLPEPARETLSPDRLQAQRQHPACGQGPCGSGPKRRSPA